MHSKNGFPIFPFNMYGVFFHTPRDLTQRIFMGLLWIGDEICGDLKSGGAFYNHQYSLRSFQLIGKEKRKKQPNATKQRPINVTFPKYHQKIDSYFHGAIHTKCVSGRHNHVEIMNAPAAHEEGVRTTSRTFSTPSSNCTAPHTSWLRTVVGDATQKYVYVFFLNVTANGGLMTPLWTNAWRDSFRSMWK